MRLSASHGSEAAPRWRLHVVLVVHQQHRVAHEVRDRLRERPFLDIIAVPVGPGDVLERGQVAPLIFTFR